MRRRLTALAAMMALALTLAFGAPVSAQDDPTEVPAVETTTDAVDDATGAVDDAVEDVDEETEDSGRWGLLGLLGLAGLAGLLKRPTRTVVEPTVQRTTEVRTDLTGDRR